MYTTSSVTATAIITMIMINPLNDPDIMLIIFLVEFEVIIIILLLLTSDSSLVPKRGNNICDLILSVAN